MKRIYIITVIAMTALAVTSFAQDTFFPIGAWMGGGTGCLYVPARYPLADSVKKSGCNIMNLISMASPEMLSALNYCRSKQLKAFVYTAIPQGTWNINLTRHNLDRFTSGVYAKYEAESNKYFTGHQTGYSDGTAWVSEPGQAGYALLRNNDSCLCDTSNPGWWNYRNNLDCRMPFTADTTAMMEDYKSEYTVKFRIKYQNADPYDTSKAAPSLPVCRIGYQRPYDGGAYNGQIYQADSAIIYAGAFSGPNVYKDFTINFNRFSNETRWVDFPVYSYGNVRLFVDYVEMQDEVWDSLIVDYGNIYSEAIRNIAVTYADTSVVYRFYLRDEPTRSQLPACNNVDRQLKRNGSGIPGFSIVLQYFPGSFGYWGASQYADTTYYSTYVQTTSPSQLAIDILPIFGGVEHNNWWVDAPYTGYGPGGYRTPVDSGKFLQQQFDVFCKYSRAANRATVNAVPPIPWWCQLQSFGDYKGPDTTYDEGRFRLPTPRELRCMTNLALAHGAKGIYYYTFSEGYIDYAGYNADSTSDAWCQLAFVDTSGRVRDTAFYNSLLDINNRIATLSPVLLNIDCDNAFKLGDGVPLGSFVTGISDSFIQAGLFHHKTNPNDKYFMLVNRHCLPTDTLTVTVTISNVEPFFITDMLTGQPASGQLPAGANVPFSYKLQPGEGRLFRIVPFTAQIKINQNATYTNFRFVQVDEPASSSLHSVDSVQVTQKYYVKAQADTAARPDYISYYWAADTSAWLSYSVSSIKYLENSIDNKANIFELQFKIGGGKILTPKYSSQILFNDVSPVNGAITINNNANFTNTQTVNVKLTGTDVFPGLSQMRFAEAPFGNASGYVNLVKNGTFEDTTNWVLDNAEFYDGFLHLKGFNVGPGPTQFGSFAKQIIPGAEAVKYRGKLLRLSDDIYSHDVTTSDKIVEIFYADSLYPNGIRLLEKSIASTPEVVWKANSDTFTLKVDTTRPLNRMEISYHIWNIETPPPPPDDDTHFNTIVVDNIRLEPVELKYIDPTDINPPQYIYDSWDHADTSYSLDYYLSATDGAKRVYMQLKDLPGNTSAEPGWYDDIILDMTLPNSNITLPLTASYINGTVNIYGFSSDLNFDKWVLVYKPYSSGDWQELTRSGVNQIDFNPANLLYTWNTGTLHEGAYLLRLTTYDKASNLKADTHFVYVAIEPALPISAVTSEFATFNSLPVDATCDNFGNVFITDTQADKIWKFSPEGDSLLCFGYSYTGQDTLGLNHPKGIAVDDSGNIWITDCYQSKVKKYDSAGNYLSTLGKHGNQQGEFNQPTGITISGNEIYVVDHLNGRVQVFNKAGAFIRQFGNNCLKQPAGIAIRQNESVKLVYVCDSQNDRIAIFDTAGNLVNSLDSLGLDKPWDICFDNNNNLYIADVYHNRVIELDPWHNKLLTFGIQGQEAGQFKLPQGLAVSPDGKYLYVADTHNDRLQRFKMFFDMGALGGAQFAGTRQITNSAPTVFGLSQCYPNPCQQLTAINYQLAKPGQVSLKVYNTLGQAVKTLVNENQQPGYYSINWDGKDESTRQVAAGIYFYRLQAGSFSSTKKAVVLR